MKLQEPRVCYEKGLDYCSPVLAAASKQSSSRKFQYCWWMEFQDALKFEDMSLISDIQYPQHLTIWFQQAISPDPKLNERTYGQTDRWADWIQYSPVGNIRTMLTLWPYRVVRARTTVSGIHVLWDGTSFNSSWPKWEMAWIVAIQLYQTVPLAVFWNYLMTAILDYLILSQTIHQ